MAHALTLHLTGQGQSLSKWFILDHADHLAGDRAEKKRHRLRGPLTIWSRKKSAGLDAAAVGVRPLVLVAEAAGADERRRGPRALVVGFVAATVEPRIAEGVGDGLTGLVAGE